MRYIAAFDYCRSRWKNQLGWTREIASECGTDGRMHWRASIAEIDHDSAFSEFSGLRREQVLLSGNGFELTFPDASTLRAAPPHDRISYPGSPAPACRLSDGPARAFNLIHDPLQVSARLLHRPLVGTMMVFSEPGQRWLIYLISGTLNASSGDTTVRLEQGDSLYLIASGNDQMARQRLLLEGGGELLMVSLTAP